MEWTKAQQEEFTHLYSELEHLPGYDKKKANDTLFKEMLPYDEAKNRIHHLIDDAKGGGLEHKVHESSGSHKPHQKNSSSPGFNPNYMGLGLAASAALFSVNPVLGALGLLATYSMSYENKSAKTKPAH